MPSSSEGLAKPVPRSLRRKSGREPGRPTGQPGSTLEMTDHPDEVITHGPGRCFGCGKSLFGSPVAGTGRRQVIDLPQHIRVEVPRGRDRVPGRRQAGVGALGVEALRDMKLLADASLAIDGTLDHADQAELLHRYHSAVLIGKNQIAALASRLLARENGYLRFIADPHVAFRQQRGRT